MKIAELREEISIELDAMELIVTELSSLRDDIGNHEPTIREKTAAAAFLAQFYNGVENILKRICLYHEYPLPTGDMWHVELFQLFAQPSPSPLPGLFDENFASTLAPYRRFRHVVLHSYGYQLDWNRMHQGVEEVNAVFKSFQNRLMRYLQSLETSA